MVQVVNQMFFCIWGENKCFLYKAVALYVAFDFRIIYD